MSCEWQICDIYVRAVYEVPASLCLANSYKIYRTKTLERNDTLNDSKSPTYSAWDLLNYLNVFIFAWMLRKLFDFQNNVCYRFRVCWSFKPLVLSSIKNSDKIHQSIWKFRMRETEYLLCFFCVLCFSRQPKLIIDWLTCHNCGMNIPISHANNEYNYCIKLHSTWINWLNFFSCVCFLSITPLAVLCSHIHTLFINISYLRSHWGPDRIRALTESSDWCAFVPFCIYFNLQLSIFNSRSFRLSSLSPSSSLLSLTLSLILSRSTRSLPSITLSLSPLPSFWSLVRRSHVKVTYRVFTVVNYTSQAVDWNNWKTQCLE